MKNEIILRSDVQRDYAINYLRNLKIDPDKPYYMTVEPYQKKRSNSQLALLWVRHAQISQAVADYTGYSAEDVHEILKQKFLPPKVIEVGDTVVHRYTTKGLTTVQMTAFMDQIEAWAGQELGLMLVHPDDRRYEDVAR